MRRSINQRHYVGTLPSRKSRQFTSTGTDSYSLSQLGLLAHKYQPQGLTESVPLAQDSQQRGCRSAQPAADGSEHGICAGPSTQPARRTARAPTLGLRSFKDRVPSGPLRGTMFPVGRRQELKSKGWKRERPHFPLPPTPAGGLPASCLPKCRLQA